MSPGIFSGIALHVRNPDVSDALETMNYYCCQNKFIIFAFRNVSRRKRVQQTSPGSLSVLSLLESETFPDRHGQPFRTVVKLEHRSSAVRVPFADINDLDHAPSTATCPSWDSC